MLFTENCIWGMFISDGIRDNSADEDFCENNILTIIVEFEGKFLGSICKISSAATET